MTRVTGALLKLGRELRYRELPIKGQPVIIESLDAVEHVLRQLATPWVTRESTWKGCDVEAGLAKYGLLDRWCNVDACHLEGAMPGIEALRINGFGPYPGDPLDAAGRTFAEDCVIDLAAELGPCVLKLFLNDVFSDTLRIRKGHSFELVPNYFPRPFTVTNACITNAPGIWVERYFYM